MEKNSKMTLTATVIGMLLFFGMVFITGAAEVRAASGINVQYHSQQEIRTYLSESGAGLEAELSYAQTPLTTAPYSAGALSDETVQSAVKMLNQVRYIAGLTYDVSADETMNQKTQAAALVNYVNGELSHTPEKPQDMSEELYTLGYNGASNSNLAWNSQSGQSINGTIINSWMEDGDSSNISRVGHRRWCLNPQMKKVGFGAVDGTNGTYAAMYALDFTNFTAEEYGVAWPAQNMPVEYFGTEFPWSVSMGEEFNVNADTVKVVLTRESDGRSWEFSSENSDGDFYVNNQDYGLSGCIIFRPSGIEAYRAGDVFQVSITGLSAPVEYTVEFFDIHEYTETNLENGVLTRVCKHCGEEKREAVVSSFKAFWNSESTGDFSWDYSQFSWDSGNQMYCWIPKQTSIVEGEADSVNYEMEFLSSDPEIISVQQLSDIMARLDLRKAGTVTLTIRPKYNPSVVRQYTLTVTGPLELKVFTVEPVSPQKYGTSLLLRAEATGGAGETQYQFYAVDAAGNESLLRDYSGENTFTWQPAKTGVYRLLAKAEDSVGTQVQAVIEEFVIEKAALPEIPAIEKTYIAGFAEGVQTAVISELLPEDCGTCSYLLETEDPDGILKQCVMEEDRLVYEVGADTLSGQTAKILVKVQSDNYEDTTVTLALQIAEKFSVTMDTASPVEIKDGAVLYYGQTLSELPLNEGTAVFKGSDGTAVTGTLQWKQPEEIPDITGTEAEWVFVPENGRYAECTGSLLVTVEKAPVEIGLPTAASAEYHPENTLSNVLIQGETEGTSLYAGERVSVAGIWKWKEAQLCPQAGSHEYSVIFEPEDELHYAGVEAEIIVEVTKAVPEVTELPEAEPMTYGSALESCVLNGGKAVLAAVSVEGTFQWKDPLVYPEVADSGSTGYEVVFVPDDSENYETVSAGRLFVTVSPAADAPNAPADVLQVPYEILTLGAVELPEGWSWETAEETALVPGEILEAIAVYSGEDRENYMNTEKTVQVTRSLCGHQRTETTGAVPAACEKEGYSGDTVCAVCKTQLSKGQTIPAFGHLWDSGKITAEATYDQAGSRIYTCLRCGVTRTEEIARLEVKIPKPGTVVQEAGSGGVYRVVQASSSGGSIQYIKPSKAKAKVVIPDTVTVQGRTYRVTGIRANAFKNNKKIKSVVIGKYVTEIGKNAFSGCTKLNTVVIGKNVKSIGQNAFRSCKRLKKITIQTTKLSKNRVGKNAFTGIYRKPVIKVPGKKLSAYRKILLQRGVSAQAKIKK